MMARPCRIVLLAWLCWAAAAAPADSLTTVAGDGTKGFGGDGGPAPAAQLADPGGIARGPDGALYICDTANHRLRRVTPDGRITTVAGTGVAGWTADGAVGTATQLNEPYEVRFDPAGNPVWVERRNHTVRMLDQATGRVRTLAGKGTPGFAGDGGPAPEAQLREPHSIAFDATGNLYIADVLNHRIRRVDRSGGVIRTFAGTGEKRLPRDGESLTTAPLFGPRALDFDRAGRLWVALREGNVLLAIDPAAGVVQWRAGTGRKGPGGDGGPARAADLTGPKGVSAAPDGKIYFADPESHTIRRFDPVRDIVERVAGDGTRGDGPDGDPLHGRLARPHGVFVDRDGAVYIGDTEAQRVRVLRPGL